MALVAGMVRARAGDATPIHLAGTSWRRGIGGLTSVRAIHELGASQPPQFIATDHSPDAYVLFWFFTAPHVRYFGPAMWLFAVCPAMAFAAGGARLGLTSTLAMLLATAIPMLLLVKEFSWSWSRPEPRLSEFRKMELKTAVNQHGVELWVNPHGLQTYDAPLPSSNHERPFLALLHPEKGIAGGFKFAKPVITSKDQLSSSR